MTKDIATLLDKYADIRETLTGELLYTLVGVGWEARAGQGFIDLYDTLMKIEQERILHDSSKWLIESDKLWWSMYALLILFLVLAHIIDSAAFIVAMVLIGIVLAALTWLKYREEK